MAGVYKRASDKARKSSGKWTVWFYDADRRRRTCPGFTDKAKSLALAHKLEADARLERAGLIEPAATAGARPVADHVAAYRADLLAKGDTEGHVDDTVAALSRLLAAAGADTPRAIAFDRVRAALAAMRAAGKSARTCNHALGAAKAFVSWLEDTGAIDRAPRGFGRLERFNEAADRRVIRRALTEAELARLLEAAERGEPYRVWRGPQKGPKGSRADGVQRFLTGPERAALYRLAMGTGFRANELRSLTPESFRLDGVEPEVVLEAKDEKARRGAVQPIRPDLAAALRPFVAGRPPGVPVLEVPEKTARMLRFDLEAAGIPFKDAAGAVVDFHALRASYITHLVNRGVNPKIVQELARHSSITLTMGRYAKTTRADVRRGLGS